MVIDIVIKIIVLVELYEKWFYRIILFYDYLVIYEDLLKMYFFFN